VALTAKFAAASASQAQFASVVSRGGSGAAASPKALRHQAKLDFDDQL
jgi:hypothetical protein